MISILAPFVAYGIHIRIVSIHAVSQGRRRAARLVGEGWFQFDLNLPFPRFFSIL
jgi:hypothetical protein